MFHSSPPPVSLFHRTFVPPRRVCSIRGSNPPAVPDSPCQRNSRSPLSKSRRGLDHVSSSRGGGKGQVPFTQHCVPPPPQSRGPESSFGAPPKLPQRARSYAPLAAVATEGRLLPRNVQNPSDPSDQKFHTQALPRPRQEKQNGDWAERWHSVHLTDPSQQSDTPVSPT
ncbi:hypothetical protein LZ30DRAFT_380331 [Colletotrichum cereale]|nr:hypothetical protein LZ30DRAFT_380331 [Colletotrichum cereale]